MLKQDCMNEYALPFAAWELRLYLDTHPNDERALAAYRQLCAAAGDKCNYACNTGDAKGAAVGRGYDGKDVLRSALRGGNSCGCGCDGGMTRNQGNGNSNGCTDGRVWHWVDGPWPCELEANVTGGDC